MTASPFPPATVRQKWHARAFDGARSTLSVPILLVFHHLDRTALETALADLMRRHQALRTTLLWTPNGYVQCPHARVDLPLEDAPADADVSPSALPTLVQTLLAEPFVLTALPLIRARLYQTSPHEHLLALVVSHAICDGWSAAVIANDLAELYRAHATDRAPTLPPLPAQFADFARAERDHCLLPPPPDWQRRLSKDHPPIATSTPENLSRPALFQSYALPTITPSQHAALRESASNLRTTVPRLIGGAVLASLSPLLPRANITIGVYDAGRVRRAHQAIVGDLVGLRPIPLPYHPRGSLSSLAATFDRALSRALNPYVPPAILAPLIRENPERRTGPLFDIAFNYLPPIRMPEPPDNERALVRPLDAPLDGRYYVVPAWTNLLPTLDYQHRPQPDGSIGGYLVANIEVVPDDFAAALALGATAAVREIAARPATPTGDLSAL